MGRLLDAVRRWAPGRRDLHAVALIGSWARGDAHAGSDVDLVLVTDTPSRYLEDAWWARTLGAVAVVRTQRWGVLTERRMMILGGLEVEFGIVGPDWVSTTPVDAGTARVVADRVVALHDPSALLARLVAAVGTPRA